MFGAFFIKQFFLMYFIYIIYSKKLERYYLGTTDDIEKRVGEHN
jgi:putative endonuclease